MRHLAVGIGKKQYIALSQRVAADEFIHIFLDIVSGAVESNAINRLKNFAHKARTVDAAGCATTIEIRSAVPRVDSRIELRIVFVVEFDTSRVARCIVVRVAAVVAGGAQRFFLDKLVGVELANDIVLILEVGVKEPLQRVARSHRQREQSRGSDNRNNSF